MILDKAEIKLFFDILECKIKEKDIFITDESNPFKKGKLKTAFKTVRFTKCQIFGVCVNNSWIFEIYSEKDNLILNIVRDNVTITKLFTLDTANCPVPSYEFPKDISAVADDLVDVLYHSMCF